MHTAHQFQIFPDGQIGRNGGLLRRNADDLLDTLRALENAFAAEKSLPARRPGQAAEHFDGGGLARAVHTQQGEQLPLPHGQVQAVHCRYLFILLRQIDDLDRVHFLSPSVSFGKNLSRSP